PLFEQLFKQNPDSQELKSLQRVCKVNGDGFSFQLRTERRLVLGYVPNAPEGAFRTLYVIKWHFAIAHESIRHAKYIGTVVQDGINCSYLQNFRPYRRLPLEG